MPTGLEMVQELLGRYDKKRGLPQPVASSRGYLDVMGELAEAHPVSCARAGIGGSNLGETDLGEFLSKGGRMDGAVQMTGSLSHRTCRACG